MRYPPLNLFGTEIRVLTFDVLLEDAPDELICSLKVVSLDDVTPKFATFCKSQEVKGLEFDWETTAEWVKESAKDVPGSTQSFSTSAASIRGLIFPKWRLGSTLSVPVAPGIRKQLSTQFLTSQLGRRGQANGTNILKTFEEQLAKSREHCINVPQRFRWGDFEALSYCWGSGPRECPITINGERTLVSNTLGEALRVLRDLPEAQHDGSICFWVDKICIDLNDIAETNHQVAMMSQIYAKAFAVVAWLGPEADGSNDVMEFMGQVDIGKHWPQLYRHFSLNELALPSQAMFAYFNRPYWYRLWIIQELVLNHNMTLFCCGKHQFLRGSAVRLNRFCITYHQTVDLQRPSQAQPIKTLSSRAELLHSTYSGRSGDADEDRHKGPPLRELFNLGRTAEVSKLSDKVYGLLGLLDPSIARHITPNYSLDWKEVFIDAAQALLERGSFGTLLIECFHEGDSPLPSWVPNWNAAFPRPQTQDFLSQNAHAGKRAVWSISREFRSLTCRGFLLGRVIDIGTSLDASLRYGVSQSHVRAGPAHEDDGAPSRNTEELNQTMLLGYWSPFSFGGDSLLDIPWTDWNSMPLDSFEQLVKPGMGHIISSPSWEPFDRMRQSNANFQVGNGRLSNVFAPLTPAVLRDLSSSSSCTLEESHRFLMEKAAENYVGRRLIRLDDGKLGLAPEATLKDDIVAILCGCSFPVVLRRFEDGYRYVGECYVHGVMSGEAASVPQKDVVFVLY